MEENKKVVFLIKESAQELIQRELGDVLSEHADQIIVKVISDEEFDLLQAEE